MAKILTMSDNPNICTGMGKVHREIAMGLHKRGHEVEALGWFSSRNHPNKMPFPVYTTRNNYYGSDIIDETILNVRPDIVLSIGDCWMISYLANPNKCGTRSMFQWINYCPIDGAAAGEQLPPTWIPIFKDADVNVAYTEYGKRIMSNSMPEISEEIKVIPHGVDTNVFKPLPTDEVRRLRQSIKLDTLGTDGMVRRKIMYLVVARNQFRKNIPEIAKGFKAFIDSGDYGNAVFWPHMTFQDQLGWNLDEVFDVVDIRKQLQFFEKVAHASSNLHLLPEHDLNRLYNAADVFVLMSGEGWGLPTVEAMACGKPVIALDHSANTELVKGRGELVKVANYQTGKYCTERPLHDEECLVRAMQRMYRHPERRKKCGEAGYKFITQGDPDQFHGKPLTWDSACDKWDEIVRELEHPLSKPVKLREVC